MPLPTSLERLGSSMFKIVVGGRNNPCSPGCVGARNPIPLATSPHVEFTEGGLEFRATGDGIPIAAAGWLCMPENFTEWERVTLLAQIEQGYAVAVDERLPPVGRRPINSSTRPSTTAAKSCSAAGTHRTRTVAADPWQPFRSGLLNSVSAGRPQAPARQVSSAPAHWQTSTASNGCCRPPPGHSCPPVRDFARRGPKNARRPPRNAPGQTAPARVAAGARLDRYLDRTVILTAAELDLAPCCGAGIRHRGCRSLATGRPVRRRRCGSDRLMLRRRSRTMT